MLLIFLLDLELWILHSRKNTGSVVLSFFSSSFFGILSCQNKRWHATGSVISQKCLGIITVDLTRIVLHLLSSTCHTDERGRGRGEVDDTQHWIQYRVVAATDVAGILNRNTLTSTSKSSRLNLLWRNQTAATNSIHAAVLHFYHDWTISKMVQHTEHPKSFISHVHQEKSPSLQSVVESRGTGWFPALKQPAAISITEILNWNTRTSILKSSCLNLFCMVGIWHNQTVSFQEKDAVPWLEFRCDKNRKLPQACKQRR